MKPQIPHPQAGVSTYNRVEAARVTMARSSDALRPMVSATTPVGTSKTICPTVNTEFTIMTWKIVSPPSRIRKMVLIAQITEDANMKSV